MNFSQLAKKLQEHVALMTKDTKTLFTVALDKDFLWETYLESFPEGTNPMYRKRREYDCSCCRSFIKHFGHVVSIKDNKKTSIWDFDSGDASYQVVINALSEYVHSQPILNVLVMEDRRFGTAQNFEQLPDGSVQTWNHFSVELPGQFAVTRKADIGSTLGDLLTNYQVFFRALSEFSPESLEIVKDLIHQGSLYNTSDAQAQVVAKLISLQNTFLALPEAEHSLFAWENSVKVGPAVCRFRSSALGTLLVDLSEGTELDQAVRSYESKVAPENYKRPKALFTPRMLEAAKETAAELGLLDSLGRRYAVLSDITVNNTLFANRNVVSQMAPMDAFDELKSSAVKPSNKNLDRLEEIPVEKFLEEVLPTATGIDVLLENRLAPNLVSLIAPKVPGCKSLVKWGNGFSWAYTGNITDSAMKQRVKDAGGNVAGVLRFSIQWNTDNKGKDDLDAHCIQPDNSRIGFDTYRGHRNSATGMIDVDIQRPASGQVAVENINWLDTSKMPEGTYKCFVHNFANHGGNTGFTAEIEFDNQIFTFVHNRPVRVHEKVPVASIKFSKEDGFSIEASSPVSTSSREIWGLATNEFHPVSICMLSPNYWDNQKGIGHKHYFFMLQKCVSEEQPNGFFNEFLPDELTPHRKVFEALGGKMRVEESPDQLSGLGFSSTKRNTVTVKVHGSFTRMLKILF